jgi:hypothetical protein
MPRCVSQPKAFMLPSCRDVDMCHAPHSCEQNVGLPDMQLCSWCWIVSQACLEAFRTAPGGWVLEG